ncbi:MAG: hypothetical protein V4721_00445 [Bacteroidota bacterium]
MKIRQCTVEDIIFILEHPWEVTKQEIENFELDKKYPTNQQLAELYLEHNYGHSFVAVNDDGVPVAAFGMAILSKTDWVCWSVRHELFPYYSKEITEIFNQSLSDSATKQRNLDGTFQRIILITSVDSIKVERWCAIIGFKKATGDGIKEYYDCDIGVYIREFFEN